MTRDPLLSNQQMTLLRYMVHDELPITLSPRDRTASSLVDCGLLMRSETLGMCRYSLTPDGLRVARSLVSPE